MFRAGDHGPSLLRGWRLDAGDVADEAVDFVADLGEVLFGAALELGALCLQARDVHFVGDDEVGVFAQQRGLAALDFGDDDEGSPGVPGRLFRGRA